MTIFSKEYENHKSFYFGKLCLNIYTLAGLWFSLGIHISLKPTYVDLHILWFIISLMSSARGRWLDNAYEVYKDD